MRKITLNKGYVALVDDADYERCMVDGGWYAAPNHGNVMCWPRG